MADKFAGSRRNFTCKVVIWAHLRRQAIRLLLGSLQGSSVALEALALGAGLLGLLQGLVQVLHIWCNLARLLVIHGGPSPAQHIHEQD